MSDREQYMPGPARGAQIRKDRGRNGEEKWTLIIVRELRHSPEMVWQAITDPAHLREWAPFDADGNLGAVGTPVKLTTVAAPTPQVSETTVKRAEALHRSPLHRNGCCRVAHLFRCSGPPSHRNSHWPHRCW